MRKASKVVLVASVVTCAAIIVASFCQPLPTSWLFRFLGRRIESKRVRIFCKTDHEALLKACRELSAQMPKGGREARVYKMGVFSGRSLPRPIRALRPREVIVNEDGTVKLSMFSGWHPFGVWASPEGYEGQRPEGAQRKLLDGLWYYDDDYRHYGHALDRAIDALVQTHCK